MPCNCILDKPTYPQNEEWGPLIWWIVHTLAEKAGRQGNPITLGDEVRAWPLFVKTLVTVIPCPYCKEHFQEYLQSHPFELPPDYTEWKMFIPLYFYAFHEAVNKRLGKPSFPFSQLSTTYNQTGRLKDVMNSLEKIMERAIKMGGVSLLAWKAWLKQYGMLRAVLL
jgi:hypothetical protein